MLLHEFTEKSIQKLRGARNGLNNLKYKYWAVEMAH